jgi:hypothetical protein
VVALARLPVPDAGHLFVLLWLQATVNLADAKELYHSTHQCFHDHISIHVVLQARGGRRDSDPGLTLCTPDTNVTSLVLIAGGQEGLALPNTLLLPAVGWARQTGRLGEEAVVRPRLVGVLVGLALLAGGCTAGGAGVETAGPGPVTGPPGSLPPSPLVRDVPQAPPQASRFTVLDPPPPLAQYATELDGPPRSAAEQAQWSAWMDQRENFVASCMAAQGFRYVPRDVSQPEVDRAFTNMVGILRVPALSADREVVVQHGYGVMGTPEEVEAAQGLAGNPNDAYLASLGAEAAAAWSSALNGDLPGSGTAFGVGCSRESLDQFPEPASGFPDRVESFRVEFGSLWGAATSLVGAGLWADPAVLALNHEWQSCMAARGFVFGGEADGAGPEAAIDVAVRTRPDGTVATYAPGVYFSDIPVEVKSLLGTPAERPVALADFDCRAETNYLERLTAIRVELDTEFIGEHRAELDRLVAAAELW